MSAEDIARRVEAVGQGVLTAQLLATAIVLMNIGLGVAVLGSPIVGASIIFSGLVWLFYGSAKVGGASTWWWNATGGRLTGITVDETVSEQFDRLPDLDEVEA